MKEYDYDLFVIGGGSGGVRASRLTAKLGLKVGLAEEFRYGGTCVIRGCVPKKLMVNAADFSDYFQDSLGFGWSFSKPKFAWEKFFKARNKEIDRLEGLYHNNLLTSGVKTFSQRASLIGPNKIKLTNGSILTSKYILLAMGGRPYVPDSFDSGTVITSNEIFELKKQPNRILIVGGGYIACEFASIFNGLGSEVFMSYRGDQILRGFDEEVRNHVSDSMSSRNIQIKLSSTVKSCKKVSNTNKVLFADGATMEFDTVLFATGRIPNTSNMGLEETGVKINGVGAVCINDQQQTSVSSIYALGDVTDRINLTPVAIRDAVAFVETVFKNNYVASDHFLVATAVFTRPEIGMVGLTEAQAKSQEKVSIYKNHFRPLASHISNRTEKSFLKLIVSDKTRKILGCHIIGPGAAELIQAVGIAVKMGATKEDFDITCAVHPTFAEEIVTLS